MLTFLKNLKLQNRIVAINVILFSVILVTVFFIVCPSFNDIKNMQASINSQYEDLDKKYKKGQSLKRLSENLKIIEPQLAKLDQAFIDKSKDLEFITTLENIAAKNDVNVKLTLGTAKPFGGSSYKMQPVQLYVQGNFINIMDYLRDIESLNYYMNVKSLELVPTAGGTDESHPLINANLSIETFWK